MVTSAYPNHSFYNQNYLNPRYTGDITPEFAGESISTQIYALIKQGACPILGLLSMERPTAADLHGIPRLAPGTSTTVTARNKISVPKNIYDILVAQNATNADIYSPIQEHVATWRYAVAKIQKYESELGYKWDRLFSALSTGLDGFMQQDGADALNRDICRDVFKYGFFGSAIEGRNSALNTDGFTTVPWNPSTSLTTARETGQYKIDDTEGSGLSKEMLEKANKWFDSHGFPQAGRNLAVTEEQKGNLRNIDQFINFDYTSRRFVENNELPQVEGFNILMIGSQPGVSSESSIIPLDTGTNKRRCVAWHKSGVCHVPWGDMPGETWEEKNMDNAKFFRASTSNGFVRKEDKAVIELDCFENVA